MLKKPLRFPASSPSRLLKMIFGNDGGGRPFAKIAAVLAGPSAEMSNKLPEMEAEIDEIEEVSPKVHLVPSLLLPGGSYRRHRRRRFLTAAANKNEHVASSSWRDSPLYPPK